MSFKDKVALITGAGSGIGRETAIKFAAGGAKVIVSDINDKGGNSTVASIKESGGHAEFIKANVANYNDVTALINQIVDNHGQLDIAVNNAGIGGTKMLKTGQHTHDDWDKIIAVNQTGVFYCLQEEVKQMAKQKKGVIVNIASVAGLRGLPNSLAYVASKHAVVGMTRTVAMEYARMGIRVNAVCPVFTLTGLFDPKFFPDPSIPEKLKGAIPMKRFSDATEIADAIIYLSSDQSSFINGHAMPVDGGLTA